MQIKQIAKEAHYELVTNIYAGHTEPFTPWLLEFAKLVAAKERERIYAEQFGATTVDAIRARGEA